DKAVPTGQVLEHSHILETAVTCHDVPDGGGGGVVVFNPDHSPGCQQSMDQVDHLGDHIHPGGTAEHRHVRIAVDLGIQVTGLRDIRRVGHHDVHPAVQVRQQGRVGGITDDQVHTG